ncbi:hypothetical protein C442_17920 [Haloarcula amylolytica JCM 13557]|uniref:Uncharacterized protein n=1 Tax=Haloarcula amylolytica JCM 13557 TaxID=1227452 RepID=M0K710_9EURY|nr:hypothetical protein C442_17920 [Haloarcula amylolytica JCM 13557]
MKIIPSTCDDDSPGIGYLLSSLAHTTLLLTVGVMHPSGDVRNINTTISDFCHRFETIAWLYVTGVNHDSVQVINCVRGVPANGSQNIGSVGGREWIVTSYVILLFSGCKFRII